MIQLPKGLIASREARDFPVGSGASPPDDDLDVHDLVFAKGSPPRHLIEAHFGTRDPKGTFTDSPDAKSPESAGDAKPVAAAAAAALPPVVGGGALAPPLPTEDFADEDTEFVEPVAQAAAEKSPSDLVFRKRSARPEKKVLRSVLSGAIGDKDKEKGGGLDARVPIAKVKVFINCLEERNQKPIELRIYSKPYTVEQLIVDVLKQYALEERTPQLVSDGALFEVRIIDDEDDLDEDSDLPPLTRTADFIKTQMRAVALCKGHGVASVEADTSTPSEDIESKGLSAFPALKGSFLRVYAEDYSCVIKVKESDTLEEAFKAYEERRRVRISQEDFEWYLKEDDKDPLDICTCISELKQDHVYLRPTSARLQEPVCRTMSEDPTPNDFLFTKESAAKYKEYEVWKTNPKGKREFRIMGIDEKKIVFKIPPSITASSALTDILGGVRPSMASLTGRVKKQEREITDITEVVKHRKKEFEISYREDAMHRVVKYKYEAVSNKESAEIVAKLEAIRTFYEY